MRYIIITYKFVIKQLKDPIFSVALAISVIMWFLNTLSGNFTSVITIPIKVEGALASSTEDENVTEKTSNDFNIDCKISGKGFNILYYSLFARIKINTAAVKVEKSQTGEYVIDIPSLESRMNEKLLGVTLINIFQKRLAFKTLTYTSKVVPVELDINIKNDGQFMQVGEIILEPSNVTIAGNISRLDSIKYIKTNFFRIENKEKSISGEIELDKIPGIKCSHDRVYYAINFQRFTEKRITKRVQIRNAGNQRYAIIPAQVDIILNVAENIYSDFNHFNFPIYIDMKDRESNSMESSYIGDNKYILTYKNLPKGVNVRSITPQYVTLLRGGLEGVKKDVNTKVVDKKGIIELIERENDAK